jgi:hypothetical protein
MSRLLDPARRHGEAHADGHGIVRTGIPRLTTVYVRTGIPRLTTVYATAPSGLAHDISRPLACLVVQGGKRVAIGARDFTFGAGDSLLITADVPTISQITQASAAEPYLSLVVELDPGIIAELGMQMGKAATGDGAAVQVGPTEGEVTEAATRLMQLIGRPAACR